MGFAIASFARSIFSPAAAAPVLRPPNRRWARGTARPEMLRLRVADVIVESPSTRTFVFEDADLPYRAGQHLTVVAGIGGRTVRRCYSFSSSPSAGARPAITVKRIEGGVMSGWLHDNVRAGDELRAMPPAGEFTIEPDPARSRGDGPRSVGPRSVGPRGVDSRSAGARGVGSRSAGARSVAMIAGGVGITPLVSMTETLLREEPDARVTLLYGSRSRDELVFHERLRALEREFQGRLALELLVEEADASWSGLVGRVDGGAVSRVAAGHGAGEWFVCGPQPMMDGAVAALAAAGVESDRIRLERFEYATASSVALPTAPAALVFQRSGKNVIASPGQTILEAAEQAGIALPSSCRMGGCGACKVKVDGKVVSAEPNCLSQRERAEGHALACCSYGDGRVVLRDF